MRLIKYLRHTASQHGHSIEGMLDEIMSADGQTIPLDGVRKKEDELRLYLSMSPGLRTSYVIAYLMPWLSGTTPPQELVRVVALLDYIANSYVRLFDMAHCSLRSQ